jgi:hypothetical protein
MTWELTQELSDAICEAIATTPRGLDYICNNNESFPSAKTVHNWLNSNNDFLQSYLRARERQADLIFDECLEIADSSGADAVIDEKTGSIKVDGEVIQRAKLRVDTRMRMAGKLSPKKYGDSTTLKGDKENPLYDVVSLVKALDGQSSGLPKIEE